MKGFYPHQINDGAVPPHEYHPAEAGSYKAGQLLNTGNGMLVAITAASTARPKYLCMAEKDVEAGELLPVSRISGEIIYQTTLSADAAAVVFGGMLQISAGGMQAETGAGAFEIVELEGAAAGDIVRGRFGKSGESGESEESEEQE